MNWSDWDRQIQYMNELLNWAAKVSSEKKPRRIMHSHSPLGTAMICISETISKLEALKAERIALGQIDRGFGKDKSWPPNQLTDAEEWSK